jgi:hypothetical protein
LPCVAGNDAQRAHAPIGKRRRLHGTKRRYISQAE